MPHTSLWQLVGFFRSRTNLCHQRPPTFLPRTLEETLLCNGPTEIYINTKVVGTAASFSCDGLPMYAPKKTATETARMQGRWSPRRKLRVTLPL